MEEMEFYLKVILKEKQKDHERLLNEGKYPLTEFKQMQALQEAIDKGPISSTEQLIKDINWKMGKIDDRFEAIEQFVLRESGLKITEGGLNT